jgi:hypothetical protein
MARALVHTVVFDAIPDARVKITNPSNDAIRQIMDWVDAQAHWRAELGRIASRQAALTIEKALGGEEELFDEVAEQWQAQLFGWSFETFLTERLASQPDNVVDDFLKRRGLRVNALGQRYLRALRDSVPSVFEIVEVAPGHHVDVKDLVLGGETVRVFERSGSRQMKRWDGVLARVVQMPEGHVFTGAILQLPDRNSTQFVEVAQQGFQQLAELAGEHGIAAARFHEIKRNALRACADAFLMLWVAVSRAASQMPHIVNSEGDSVAFHTRRYELKRGARARVLAALDAHVQLQATSQRPRAWTWLQPRAGEVAQHASDAGGKTLVMDSAPVDAPELVHTASLELNGDVLTVETNSAARDAAVRAWLELLLGADALTNDLQARSIEEALAENRERAPRPPKALPRRVREKLEREALDRHYREWLDMRLPALDDATPRQAASDPRLRPRLIDLLKDFENISARRGAEAGAGYDTAWLWAALGLSAARSA